MSRPERIASINRCPNGSRKWWQRMQRLANSLASKWRMRWS